MVHGSIPLRQRLQVEVHAHSRVERNHSLLVLLLSAVAQAEQPFWLILWNRREAMQGKIADGLLREPSELVELPRQAP